MKNFILLFNINWWFSKNCLIKINNKVTTEKGTKIDPSKDIVHLKNKLIKKQEEE